MKKLATGIEKTGSLVESRTSAAMQSRELSILAGFGNAHTDDRGLCEHPYRFALCMTTPPRGRTHTHASEHEKELVPRPTT